METKKKKKKKTAGKKEKGQSRENPYQRAYPGVAWSNAVQRKRIKGKKPLERKRRRKPP